jgi:hypothetical protein
MLRYIETITGKGTVSAFDGRSQNVRYVLDVYQHMIRVGNTSFPGTREIRCRIAPVCFFGENGATLEMDDGRKMRLLVIDVSGTVFASPIE